MVEFSKFIYSYFKIYEKKNYNISFASLRVLLIGVQLLKCSVTDIFL